MQTFRQLAGSTILALLSLFLVIGGISLALAENGIPTVGPTETGKLPPPTIIDTPTFIIIVPTNTSSPIPYTETASPAPTATDTSTPTATPTTTLTPTGTILPTQSVCPAPLGWVAVIVKPLDTLASLALQYNTTPENLGKANCLPSQSIYSGMVLYVPPVAPVPTKTIATCGPPPGWTLYTVQPGDTIYRLSQSFKVTVSQLQQANCMQSYQTNIQAGQRIWAPPGAMYLPTATPISIIFPTLTYTATELPSATPTASPVPTLIPTETPLPTLTSAPPTAQPTMTMLPSPTASP